MTPKTLLMTRPRDASERFVARLSPDVRNVLDVLVAPLLKIVPTDAVVSLSNTDVVLFTSANGARLTPPGKGRMAFCVGQRTAQAAMERGWDVDLIAEDADELVARLTTLHSPTRLHHLAGHHRRGNIAQRLGAEGWDVIVTELYDQRLCPLSATARGLLAGEADVILPLFSPRTAAHLSQEMGRAPNAQIIALSPAVAAEIKPSHVGKVHVVAAPTGDMMAQAIEKLVQGHSSP